MPAVPERPGSGRAAVAALAVLFAGPLLVLPVQALADAWRAPALLPQRLGTRGLRVALTGQAGSALVNSLVVAVATTALALLLGWPAARALGGHRLRRPTPILLLLAMPLLAPVTRRQHDILRRMGLDVQVGGAALGPADLVLDGLLGYSQAGPPRGDAARLLRASAGRRVLALDVPSGLELATGTLHSPHVVAVATMTLAAPKQALRAPDAAVAVGALYLADISVPPLVWERLGLAHASPFGTHPIARIGGNLDASL